jgi:prepilin-type processing-associated H-X9-DG protein
MACQNNLKQLAVGLHNYHDVARRLPIGRGARWDGSAPPPAPAPRLEGTGSTLHALLPYLEQDAIYAQFDFTQPIIESQVAPVPYTTIRRHKIPAFVCPSDESGGATAAGIALATYASSSGPSRVNVSGPLRGTPCSCVHPYNAFALPANGQPAPGPFGTHNSLTRPQPPSFSAVTDGLSNTIAFGELRIRCSGFTSGGWANSNNGSGIATTIIPLNYNSCEDPAQWRAVDGCRTNCNDNVSLGFKSRHPGGVQFALCDGAVRFIADTIDHPTLQLLGAMSDGRPVSPP